ncbi:pollen-specific leucine-rich repeat extensin-like protein 1 [Fopius arisanus]|uniref:Pollen-specific leucine-rich repeat extensin-like protein 1 n=1 Tax=Fopius arisanus TaxID=64838 RepID=A0A9R1TS50_9HYME|nr:PREDICTED: pollen-specific leucine-rich repeat extensin-like protein 1 [Fopius arisanus]
MEKIEETYLLSSTHEHLPSPCPGPHPTPHPPKRLSFPCPEPHPAPHVPEYPSPCRIIPTTHSLPLPTQKPENTSKKPRKAPNSQGTKRSPNSNKPQEPETSPEVAQENAESHDDPTTKVPQEDDKFQSTSEDSMTSSNPKKSQKRRRFPARFRMRKNNTRKPRKSRIPTHPIGAHEYPTPEQTPENPILPTVPQENPEPSEITSSQSPISQEYPEPQEYPTPNECPEHPESPSFQLFTPGVAEKVTKKNNDTVFA